jgi:hypothetical protein
LAFDGQGVLHLVWGDTQQGFYHQQMAPGSAWSEPELLTGEYDTVFDLVSLQPNPDGEVCVFLNAAVGPSVGLYKHCRDGGQWTPVGEQYARGDWDHPPAFASDGTLGVLQLSGPGNAPVLYREESLSSDEGFVYHPQLAVDQRGGTHALWERADDDSRTIEYRYSGDGGQTWTALQVLADMPTLLGSLEMLADGQGNVHAVGWAGAEGVYYKRWTDPEGADGDGWAPVQRVSGDLEGGSWGDAAAGPDGRIHVVWGNEFADIRHYVQQKPDGSWTQPRPITEETVNNLRIAVDGTGGRHFVWIARDGGLYYVAVPPPSAP